MVSLTFFVYSLALFFPWYFFNGTCFCEIFRTRRSLTISVMCPRCGRLQGSTVALLDLHYYVYLRGGDQTSSSAEPRAGPRGKREAHVLKGVTGVVHPGEMAAILGERQNCGCHEAAGEGCNIIMDDRSLKTVDLPLDLGRSTSGFRRPDKRCLHQRFEGGGCVLRSGRGVWCGRVGWVSGWAGSVRV